MGSDFLNIFVIGISHDTTPIQIREKVFFSEHKKISALNELKKLGLTSIILSTCNRCEIYISSEDIKKDSQKLKNFFLNYFDVVDLSNYIFEKYNLDAINHIYYVTSGLDSTIIGEDQILGQVKDALDDSLELDVSDKYLNKIFREAITTAKKIKSTLKISQTPLSLSSIAIKILENQIRDIQNKKVVIVGTGKMGLLAINHLVDLGITKIYCCNRSYEKVQKIIEKYPFIKNFDYDDRYALIQDSDILITSTSSPHLIIKDEHVKDIKKHLYMIDLSMPRDIDDRLKQRENVTLYDIDDFDKISNHNISIRKNMIKQADDMIQSSIDELLCWAKSTKVDTTIKSLNEKCDNILYDTMLYINRKVELNHREQKIIQKMISSALQRLIKEPIIALKQIDEEKKQEKYISAINDLFDL